MTVEGAYVLTPTYDFTFEGEYEVALLNLHFAKRKGLFEIFSMGETVMIHAFPFLWSSSYLALRHSSDRSFC